MQMLDVPLVSVCIPCHNAENTISKTLDSILAQTYKNIEIIVSDNQSTDKTKEIVLLYADRGVRLVDNPPVVEGDGRVFGAFDNWDYVLSQGRGDFLCLYHADDLYDPEIIEKETNFLLDHRDSGAVVTQWRLIDENDHVIQLRKASRPFDFKQNKEFSFSELFDLTLRYQHFLNTPTLMIRKDVLLEIGPFNEEISISAADLDYFLRISLQFKLGIVNEELHFYRLSASHATANIHRRRTKVADYFIVMEHYINLIGHENISTAALNAHEVYLCKDRIRCAFYLMWRGERRQALTMAQQGLEWNNLRTIQGWKICLPGVMVYVALMTGLDSIVGCFLNWRFGKNK
ncbi:MAG TPA: glycosyltransferase [Gammaproteobacteria bacterium]|nr:glycosyltransferase [Gammaproteobacteria bacterium]